MAGVKGGFIALDQLANAIIGGEPDETLSARAWRLRQRPAWGRAQRIIDRLFFWEAEHCRASYDSEINRQQMPGIYRRG